MENDKSATAAFTGHRDYDGRCDEALKGAIHDLYNEGYRTFMSGMAVGFDLAAAEAVLSLRNELPGIRLACIIPFEGQERRFGENDAERFRHITGAADDIVTLSHRYTPYAYARRNDFLADNSSAVIAYCSGRRSGTEYTVRRASRQSSRIINLYGEQQSSFDF